VFTGGLQQLLCGSVLQQPHSPWVSGVGAESDYSHMGITGWLTLLGPSLW
jgi:hypothetical protein